MPIVRWLGGRLLDGAALLLYGWWWTRREWRENVAGWDGGRERLPREAEP